MADQNKLDRVYMYINQGHKKHGWGAPGAGAPLNCLKLLYLVAP